MLSHLLLRIVDQALGIPSNFLVPSTEYIDSKAGNTMGRGNGSSDSRGAVDHSGDVNSARPRIETPDSIVKILFEPVNDASSEAEFKPSGRVYLAFATLAILILMVSLDGTIISVGLPVRTLETVTFTFF